MSDTSGLHPKARDIADCLNTMVSIGKKYALPPAKAQSYFEWGYNQLVTFADTEAASDLFNWWIAHPDSTMRLPV